MTSNKKWLINQCKISNSAASCLQSYDYKIKYFYARLMHQYIRRVFLIYYKIDNWSHRLCRTCLWFFSVKGSILSLCTTNIKLCCTVNIVPFINHAIGAYTYGFFIPISLK